MKIGDQRATFAKIKGTVNEALDQIEIERRNLQVENEHLTTMVNYAWLIELMQWNSVLKTLV